MPRFFAMLRNLLLALMGGLFALPGYSQVSFVNPPPSYMTQYSPDFVADFNSDGKPDILSGNVMNLGNGDGTFRTGTPVPGTPLAVADFNGDGKPDVVEQGQGTLEVLLGNGDGTFQAPISTNISAILQTVVAGDLRGDGKSDIVGFSNNNLIIYLGNGDGTFAPGVSYPIVASPPIITLGDFNGDSKIDVVVSEYGGNVLGQEVVFLGNGDGTLQAGKISTGVSNPGSVVEGDFNGDGKLDLMISNSPGCNCGATSILLGNGDGTFQAPNGIISGVGSLAVGDVNGDGKLDLVLLDESVPYHFPPLAVYLGKGDGTFSNTHTYQSNFSSGFNGPVVDGPVLADFNSDGKLDIAGAATSLLGNGDGTFKGWPALAGGSPLSVSAIATGDFDKNGTQDVAAGGSSGLYIFSNDGTGALSLTHTYPEALPFAGIATADLNGDGNLDLVVVSGSQNVVWSYTIYLGNGDGSFQSPIVYQQSTMLNGSTIVIADFNNDHKLDLAIPAGDASFALLLGNGDGTFGAPTYVFDNGASSIVAADFNGDGKLDIAASAGGMAVLLGNGDGTFQAATFPFRHSWSFDDGGSES